MITFLIVELFLFYVMNDTGENMNLTERFRGLVDTSGMSLQEVADKSSVPFETVRNIYYGKVTDPKVSTVMKLANLFHLSVNCLMGQCTHTREEKAMLQYYRQCGTHGKSVIELVAKYEAVSAKAERESVDKHKIPCLFPRGEIRKGIVYDLCETKDIEVCTKDAFVAIQMTDNDLAPVFCRGDIILFEDRFPENGEIAAFFKTDRVYVRKFIEENGKYILKSLYPQGDDIILKRMNEMEYIGTCIGVVRE